MVLSPVVRSDGDVVGLVEDALVEVGEAGVEEVLWGDGFAVEEGLVGSEGGDGEACGLDGGGELRSLCGGARLRWRCGWGRR